MRNACEVRSGNQLRDQVNISGHEKGKVSMKFQANRGFDNRKIKLSASSLIGLGCKLQPSRRRLQSAAFIASASASVSSFYTLMVFIFYRELVYCCWIYKLYVSCVEV